MTTFQVFFFNIYTKKESCILLKNVTLIVSLYDYDESFTKN